MPETTQLKHLKDLWDDARADQLGGNELSLLRYRSNLLGADLRITNFGGGNTSSKIELPDPFTGAPVRVLAVKGSGGDLGSITDAGFALLYLDKLEQLKTRYRGEAFEDEMVGYYPPAAFGHNRVAASIDTPLHAFLPAPHVDHLHPDWAIALAASANGAQKLEEFNRRFDRHVIWVPWQRPGFELALLIEAAVNAHPRADGLILGSHGLFTWGTTQRECYLNSIRTIDQMGAFIDEHRGSKPVFGGMAHKPLETRREIAARILPALRGTVSSNRRVIAHFTDSEDALTFAGSRWATALSRLGTSCPDHFLRTRICPFFVDWDPSTGNLDTLKAAIRMQVGDYRAEYQRYYEAFATADSPKLRDSNPSVVIIPGIGLFGFGRNKKEARITTEFFLNAINVMSGATALETADLKVGTTTETTEHAYVVPTFRSAHGSVPQARRPEQAAQFEQYHNYVALPRSEAFRIEYWALEEAKLQRMPPEAEFGRKIVLIVGGGSGIGREVALLLARKGAHIVVADAAAESAARVAEEAAALSSAEFVASTTVDLASSDSLSSAAAFTVLQFGGIDGIVNTAAIYPVADASGRLSDAQWAKTFLVNVTGNYLLAQQTEWVLQDQQLPAALVLTGSANAVVSKKGSEAYDTSKSAVNHLIRELAIGLAPVVRVNGIAPATVVSGSTMFPRDRVIQSLQKYTIAFAETESTEDLRSKLADFYAQRTLTRRPILPKDCANAIVWLLSDDSAKTTGHIIPVDGGLTEAFLR
ncbi:MAG TPA: bifunctional rhamnulose-1-phosphate aldolase/short-chain dehydrogenase [Vicinamibacterales bacterium]|nr:bifunctional rhamnulose-1-phosphate aldolase/short-chain dehydrogenase [Vicinamibacterales bacterium]